MSLQLLQCQKQQQLLGHLNSIKESDASWCNAVEIANSNKEIKDGITIKGSRGPTVEKLPPL